MHGPFLDFSQIPPSLDGNKGEAMEMHRNNRFIRTLRLLAVSAFGLALGACNFNNDGTSSTLKGTVATGAPVSGANIAINCASGNSYSTSSNAGGAYSITIPANAFPCVLKASGGNLGALLPGVLALYSFAQANGIANVTPLTDLAAALQIKSSTGQSLGDWFDDPAQWSSVADAFATAVDQLRQALVDAGYAVPGNWTAGSSAPVTQRFTPGGTDPYDMLLEALANAIESSGMYEDFSAFLEAFLGDVEIAAALLLIYRKTASIGAMIIIFFTGNVLMSNLAYEGGEYVYSAYLISLAGFVLSYDACRLTSFLVLRKPTAPNTFKPGRQTTRLALKSLAFAVFIVLYGFTARYGYHHDPYQIPTGKGLTAAAGVYNVALFRIGHDTIPYSPTDTLRWKNVVFEKWPTISIADNRPADIDSENIENITAVANLDKTYESEGTNGRRYYDYSVDTAASLLRLKNKNPHDSLDTWSIHYERPDQKTIILSGITPGHDSIYIVLDRIDKKYLLEEAAHTGRNNSHLKL